MKYRCWVAGWFALFCAGPLVAAPPRLTIAVVPIVNQGHFLEWMLAEFAAREGVELRIQAQHGRKAVAAVQAKAVDLVITHADFAGVAALVHAGHIRAGAGVFANPIALLGPADDPADVAAARTPEEALARIAAAQRCVIPNDLQHLRDLTPASPARCAAPDGTGMAAIRAAVRTRAYVWWGLHPFLQSGQPLVPRVWSEPRLLRLLMAWIPVGPHEALAERAVAALRSAEGQERVAAFRFPAQPTMQVWWPFAARDRLAEIRARGRLHVAMKNIGARAAGDHRDPAHVAKRAFESKIAAALAARILGDAARLVPVTLRKPERLPAVAGGAADLGLAMLRPTARSRVYTDFSVPYFTDGLAVMHRAGESWGEASALKGRRVLSLARDALGQEDERLQLVAIAGEAVPTTPVATFAAAADLIAAGAADALVSQAVNIDAFLRDGPSRLARSPILGGAEFAVAVPKDSPALKALVDAEIERLRADGTLQRWASAAGFDRAAASMEDPDVVAVPGSGRGQGKGQGHGRGNGRRHQRE